MPFRNSDTVKYSIIVPTLNEEVFLPKLVEHLAGFEEDIELIIADGGSVDSTIETAKSLGVNFCVDSRGRGMQLNCGAELTRGEILIFLHCDTFLPADAFREIDECFSDGSVTAATFRLRFDADNWMLNFYSWFTRFDSLFTTFGDQAIIVKREDYLRLGMFPSYKIFDDVEFLRNARKNGGVKKLDAEVVTSARRFTRLGFVKTQVLNFWYILLYLFGVDKDYLHKKYFNGKRQRNNCIR